MFHASPEFTRLRLVLLVGAAALIGGCGTDGVTPAAAPAPAAQLNPAAAAQPPAPPPDPTPIDMAPGGSRPVAFQRVVFNITPGATIGALYVGPMKLKRDVIKAPSLQVGSEQYALIARDEMRKLNYTMLGGENLIFGTDEAAKARYQLGAQVSDMHLDVYGSVSFWSGKTSVQVKGDMRTDWQVYDTFTHKVVYTQTTNASLESDGDGEKEFFALFRKNLRRLLASKEFVDFMRPESGTSGIAAASQFGTALSLPRPGAEKAVSLPADLPKLFDSVVTIKPGTGFATGFLITSVGHVLTAAHVVSGLKTVPVRLHNGLVLDGEVLRVDEGSDVAIVKLPGSSYKTLQLASSSPATGADVYAIGNPALEELSYSVSKGVLSGERELAGRKFLQTDVSANPGNSGGPLLDASGHVVGVISWKVAAPGYEGLTFAVPVGECLAKLNLQFADTESK